MAPPTPMDCEVPDCQYTTRAGLPSFEHQFTALRLHLAMAHPEVQLPPQQVPASSQSSSTKAEKLPRPTLGEDVTEVEWSFFTGEWQRYKRATGVTGQIAMDQLWACATDSLKKSCHQSGATDSTTEEQLLEFMKKLSIKATNKLVNVVQFLSLAQDTDEPVTQFVSRLKGQSSVCDFEIKCSRAGCDTNVSYSDKMVSHQLVRGLEDASIQEKVLALAATDKDLDLKKITEFIQAQETGSRSSKLLGSGVNIGKISDFKKGRSVTLSPKTTQDSGDGKIPEKCYCCGKSGHGTSPDVKTREAVCPAWEAECYSCGKIGHFKSVCKKKASTKKVTWKETDYEESDDESGRVFSLFSYPTKRKHKRRKMKTLSHIAKDKFGRWVGTKPNPHPVVIVGVSVSGDSYKQLEIPEPAKHQPTNVQAIADTGATVLVGGMDLAHQLSVKKHELIPVSSTVGVVNHGQLELLGGLLLDISLGDREHQELCYIAKGVKDLLLSTATMKALGIISENFPSAIPAPAEVQRCERRGGGSQSMAHPQLHPHHQLPWQPLPGGHHTTTAAPPYLVPPNMMIGAPGPSQHFTMAPMFPVWSPPAGPDQFTSMYGRDGQPWMTESRTAPLGWGGRR